MSENQKVAVYRTSNGKEPFTEWLRKLDIGLRERVLRRLTRVVSGNFGSSKALGKGLYELKFEDGLRIYYAKINKVTVLLLAGGNKNTKHGQSADIEKAREYLRDYGEEQNGG
jgi:putative addiction module killer protein